MGGGTTIIRSFQILQAGELPHNLERNPERGLGLGVTVCLGSTATERLPEESPEAPAIVTCRSFRFGKEGSVCCGEGYTTAGMLQSKWPRSARSACQLQGKGFRVFR